MSTADGSVRGRVPGALVGLLCIGLFLLLHLRADAPLGVRNDSWTEANIIVSARNVALNGWQKYHGVPQHQVDRPPFESDPFFLYAQYPPGSYYVAWLLFDAQDTTPSRLRWPPTFCAVATLICWYLLLCRVVTAWTALLSTLLLGTSYGFLAYADDLHHGYSLAFVTGMMLSYVTALTASGRRRLLWMAASWALLFVNSFISWEWYLWSQVFLWGHAFLLGVPFKKRWLLVFALAPLIAVGIQSAVRMAAFGPDPGGGMLADLLRRTVRLEDTFDTPRAVTLATYVPHVAHRFEEFYGFALGSIGLLVLAWAAVVTAEGTNGRDAGPALRWIVLLFLCGASWWCVMLQHTSVHPHVMRHELLFYALALGVSLATALRYVFGSGRSRWSRVVAVMVAVWIVGPHASGTYSDIRMYLDPSYDSPYSWAGGWNEAKVFAALADRVPADAIVLTNSNRPPLLRYWTRRPIYYANLLREPFRRNAVLPGSHTRLALAVSHLQALYGAEMPPVVYVYWFSTAADAAYTGDPILWQLVDGTWTRPTTHRQLANFRALTRGGGHSKYPIVVSGPNWIAFAANKLFENLPPEDAGMAAPTRAQFGPPW